MDSGHYTVIAGGSGAAKFLRGLTQVVPEDRIHVIVNVGDELTLMVIRVDPNERRIGLSLKELAAIVDEPMPSDSRGRQKGRKRRGGDDDYDEED